MEGLMPLTEVCNAPIGKGVRSGLGLIWDYQSPGKM